ncbi:hypothetical protein UFOVP116_296 [uncultured Caudovirales phage]|uniref:Uncharacterized protein n=1 Tax=uncultured Caudovirales phage TaxID=2100421 RepID=A0A6J5LA35_9CAUD|nr:hypothetical protein UFOVP116_296 [uncultured Caudovirales phage]
MKEIIEQLNQQYCEPQKEKTPWACVVELAALIPEADLARLFREHQTSGWPMPIVRSMARLYSHK